MIQVYNISLKDVAIHHIGNKNLDEGINFSNQAVSMSEELEHVLTNYFIRPFIQNHEYFNLNHDLDLKYNEVYSIVNETFEDPNRFFLSSINLAKHLYENSNHPNIKVGEFFAVYIKNCLVDEKKVDAIGLFKSENKDTFLKIKELKRDFEIESDLGINTNKLDKGCIIFNTEKEDGFLVSVIDNTNKGAEARYWKEDFLNVTPRHDEYFITQNALSLCKNFASKELPNQFDISKADQVDLINKSVQYFKENKDFNFENYTSEVIEDPDVITSFQQFKFDYEMEKNLEIGDNFSISKNAVKKEARKLKNVIKLDKNFHIYIHGDRNLIEQGIDNNGRKYYKIFYHEEK